MDKTIKIFKEVQTFTARQLENQTKKQIRFLKAIYPFLEDREKWSDGCIELRPLRRDASSKDYVRSYNSWHSQEKDVEALRKFLGMINGKGYCLYFSSFAFDYHKEVIKKDGKKFGKGKINNSNAMFTWILPMDFDGISAEEFRQEKQKLLDLNIETIDIMTGHGYQSFILLEKRVLDKEILKKFTTLMIAKGFKIDEALQDPARVLRMPYSFNYKALDKDNKYYDPISPEIIAVTDVSWTEKRYKVVEVFERLNGLPDVIPQYNPLTEIDIKLIPTTPIPSALKERVKSEIQEVQEVGEIRIQSLKIIYNMLDFEKLPEAVQKILNGSVAGHRNQVRMFLIPFLRNSLGLNIQTIKQVMVLWGERCSPCLAADYVREDVDRIYRLGFKGKSGKYTEELRKAYGYLEFSIYKKQNKIILPNALFDDYCELPDGAVRIYMAMKLAESVEGGKTFGKVDIQKYALISERSIERNMSDLVLKGYICKRRANRRNGEGYAYYINTYFNSIEGFTMLENAAIKLMLNGLTDGEIKLYSYLSKIVSGSMNECWASQKYLAKKIGKKGHGSISKMTDSLHRKHFITKKTVEKNGIRHSSYTLNY
jgi:hypothetical protein